MLRNEPDAVVILVTVVAVSAIIFAAFTVPGAREYIVAHSLLLSVAGWLFAGIVLSLGLFGSGYFDISTNKIYESIGMPIVVGLGMIGMAVATLPRAMRDSQTSIELIEKVSRIQTAEDVKPSAVALAIKALAAPFRDFDAMLWLGIPWILFIWLIPRLVLRVCLGPNGFSAFDLSNVPTHVDPNPYAIQLLSLVFLILVGIPAFAIAWQRHVLGYDLPRSRIPLPNWRSVRLTWRLLIFFVAVGTLIGLIPSNAHDIPHLVNSPYVDAIGATMSVLIAYFAVVMSAPYGVVSAAIAADRSVTAQSTMLIVMKRVGRGCFGGIAVVLLPFVVGYWCVCLMQTLYPSTAIDEIGGLINCAVLIFGVASLFGYFAQLYSVAFSGGVS